MINFVQISDLHIGANIGNTSGSPIPGLTAHDISLCTALTQFLDEDVRDIAGVNDEEDIPVIINGDITSSGRKVEFDVANTFLLSHHELRRSNQRLLVGLDCQEHLLHSVPGNHDHWQGRRYWPNQRGFSREIYDEFRVAPPSVSPPICDNGVELRIFTVDSCSMFEETLLNISPLANGGFSKRHKQVLFRRLVQNTLKEPLAEGCSQRVAAIVCHHPFSRDGVAGPLRDECIGWLVSTAANLGIRIVLTGHTHYSWTTIVQKQTQEGFIRVREVRCPTTLQYPAKLDEKHRKPGLWLHQIYADKDANGKDEIVWRGTLVLYCCGSFYVPTRTADSQRPERSVWFEERMPSCF